MENGNGDWLDINAAAALVGRSPSTIRRLLPDIPAPNTKREPLAGQGGYKVLIARPWLLSNFGLRETERTATQEPPPSMVTALERQLEQKDRQINALQMQISEAQRQVGELAERLAQVVAVNTALAQKLLPNAPQAEQGKGGGPGWYTVGVSVAVSLIIGLLTWLWLRWLGG